MIDFNPIRPDFAVVGVPYGDQVILIASRSIFHGELRHETDFEEVYNAWYAAKIPTNQRFEIELSMNRYVLIVADSYQAAFSILFDQWRPDDQRSTPRKEITGGQLAIDE